jgi:hypothetical protein
MSKHVKDFERQMDALYLEFYTQINNHGFFTGQEGAVLKEPNFDWCLATSLKTLSKRGRQ